MVGEPCRLLLYQRSEGINIIGELGRYLRHGRHRSIAPASANSTSRSAAVPTRSTDQRNLNYGGKGQCAVRAPARKVKSIEQPVELLTGERHQPTLDAWPVETLPLEALLPQHKTASLPVEDLAAVVPRLGEHE